MPDHGVEITAPWLELREAADFLGIHFTTLRRWADGGKVPYIRTPSGRRRFHRAELAMFLANMHLGEPQVHAPAGNAPRAMRAVNIGQRGMAQEAWYQRLNDTQRNDMRQGGQQLMAVLMQYSTRSNGGEAFLSEGRRLAQHYGEACYHSGLTLVETVRAFLGVCRSIKDAVYQAGTIAGTPDADTWRLYERMTNFLDSMFLAIVEAYDLSRARVAPSA